MSAVLEAKETASFDDAFTISCGKCATSSPAIKWTQAPVSGDLPAGEFQCPICRAAFRRQPKADRKPWDTFVEIVQIGGRL